jgi:hypothetical protein
MSSIKFFVRYQESQSTIAKYYELTASTLIAAKREASKWLDGCQPGSGSIHLFESDPRLTGGMARATRVPGGRWRDMVAEYTKAYNAIR